MDGRPHRRATWRPAIAAIVCLLAMPALPCADLRADGDAPDAVTSGKELYDRFGCYQCHGHFGQGGVAGPKLAPDPLPLEAFRVFVRTPVARMPPYSVRVLSEAQLESIHRYLQSLEATPPASDIPLLDLTVQPPATE